MEEYTSKVYILLDEQNRITRIDGGYSISNVDTETWTFIDEGTGDRYNLCQSHYLEKGLMTEDGIYNYKYENGEVIERSAEEIEAERQARENVPTEPTQLDRVEAQTMWTALMTDTLLEE